MRSQKVWCSIVLAFTLSAAAYAKDWGDVLLEKGLITPQELEQTRKEIEESQHPEQKNEGKPAPPSTEAGQKAAIPSMSALLKQFELSTLIYGDWAYYTHSGYGPQFLTQINPPAGPNNGGFNSFDITRTYLNLVWRPSDRFLIRVTPNIYREISPSSQVPNSNESGTATNLSGNLGFRLKYGFLQVNDVLYKGQNIKFGQIENPLVPWEEDLYGYRFVNLVPLNYLAYSSTDLGIAATGPITLDGAIYGDYWFGIYNGSSFHSAEFDEKRSPQGRLSVYPFAKIPSLAGLGITGFGSYGYTDVAPDQTDLVIKRLAGLLHYNTRGFGIAFEFDATRNENNFNNFFSASGPLQTITVPDPASPGKTLTVTNPLFDYYNKTVLTSDAAGQGWAVFGHYDIGNTPFSLFGMWHRWYPNTHVPNDPLDFDRIVGGVAYRVNSWLRVAADSQNLVYLNHGPYVPTDTHAFFTNFEINYK
jgi:hypothetical protein